ncbi:MAG TPA: hypothetical protein VJQ55_10790 [Candidatus Binatia bacterium]|nr:hypothetical protein [Candidatus Binatia bacterium]
MKLGTKLIISLVATTIAIMLIHGYLSIQQDRENIVREMRVGMIGLGRSIQAALRYIYGDAGDIAATQNLIDGVGRTGNIHGVIVYDRNAVPVAVSASLKNSPEYPNLHAAPVLGIDPRETLNNGNLVEGYIEHPAHPVYYRVEAILNGKMRSRAHSCSAGAVLALRRPCKSGAIGSSPPHRFWWRFFRCLFSFSCGATYRGRLKS